ncbi:uncharacterized protein LOC120176198 [Hibiscus syriacus]|uniref:uncharacterized protein LOC120176198 n=1 Tax=Hibiscus syriacus TaxID=106335 RepID=UPI001924C0A0|nr:uncharacterized protein LOC120176198 [Hibiscus syriacus]
MVGEDLAEVGLEEEAEEEDIKLSTKPPFNAIVVTSLVIFKMNVLHEERRPMEQVKLGNNTRMMVKGRGSVRLHRNGINHLITGVFYVPELKNNLLRMEQLQEKGLTILIQARICKMYHPDKEKSSWRASQKLQLIHADICGPITPMSNSIKRRPTVAVKDIIPEEAWSGVKPSVKHFLVFGCLAHVHVPDDRRNKLDDMSFECVLLGVNKEWKGYGLYDPVAKRVVTCKDEDFEEDKE